MFPGFWRVAAPSVSIAVNAMSSPGSMLSSSNAAPQKGVKRSTPHPSFMMLSALMIVISLGSAPTSFVPASTETGSEAASIAPNIMPVFQSKNAYTTKRHIIAALMSTSGKPESELGPEPCETCRESVWKSSAKVSGASMVR